MYTFSNKCTDIVLAEIIAYDKQMNHEWTVEETRDTQPCIKRQKISNEANWACLAETNW